MSGVAVSAVAGAAKKQAIKKAETSAATKMNARKNSGSIPGEGKHSKNYEVSTPKNNSSSKSPAKRDGRSLSEKTSDNASRAVGNRPRYWEPRTVAGYRRMLTAFFIVAVFIVVYRAIKNTDYGKTFWRQLGAIWLTFFFLALASSISWKVARICAMLGGLIATAMVVKDADLIQKAAASLQSGFGTHTGPQDTSSTAPFISGGGGSF